MDSEQIDHDRLAEQVVQKLDPGTVIDNKIILTRRQLAAVAAGTLSVGALLSAGAGEASADTAGGIGSEDDPIDAELASVNGGGVVSAGDGTDRRIWVIDSGASDPSDAADDDLIFEEAED